MPVFEQGYRKYVGERSRTSRVLPIAWENIRTRMRWWSWALLGITTLMLGPYGLYAVLIFVSTIGGAMFGQAPIAPAAAPTAAWGTVHFGPGAVLGLLQQRPLGLAWELLDHASHASVIFPAVVASGLLASDRRTGALQIYFSRPVTRMEYLLGKVVACASFVALTTVVPCLVLWAETVAFGSTSSYTWRTWVAPFAIVGASALYALWTVALVLAFSSLMRRPALVAIVAIFTNLALEGIGKVLSLALHDNAWHVIQPSYAIGSLTAPLCGLTVPDWINPVAAICIGLVLPLALLAFVAARLRAVEVST
jgi:ABC-type transport system involved in multi-copper enzyme maturation permease subunit